MRKRKTIKIDLPSFFLREVAKIQVRFPSGGRDPEKTILAGQQGHNEGSSSEIGRSRLLFKIKKSQNKVGERMSIYRLSKSLRSKRRIPRVGARSSEPFDRMCTALTNAGIVD
jgi:hypothetical protein